MTQSLESPRDLNVDDVRLASAAYTTFQEIAQVLRTSEKNVQLKIFYASLTAYCVIIRNHTSRIGQASVGSDNELITRTLCLLDSTIVLDPSTAEASTGARIRTLIRHWGDVRKLEDTTAKLQLIQPCLSFGKTAEECNDFLLSLATCEEELATRYPENSLAWMAEDFAPQKKIKEPSYAVWKAAQSMFNALVSCNNCPCEPAHEFGARLRLGTYRQPTGTACDMAIDAGQDFNMFLSMKKEWHEARVHMAKESVVRFGDGAAQLRRKIIRPKVQPSKVKSLCEPITKIMTMWAYRLELKVMREKLFILKPEKSESLVDRATEPVPLEYFLKSGSRSFTERTRRILAVILSSAVLHLHDTPWLKSTWSSSDVLFFRTSSSAIPLRPFLQTQLSSLEACPHYAAKFDGSNDNDTDKSDGFDPDDIDPDDTDFDDLIHQAQHHCPTLVTLAIILMEVYFVTPFDLLARNFGVILDEDETQPDLIRYINANLVFQACKDDLPEDTHFHQAVEKCLDPEIWEDDNGDRLDSETLRARIYEEIVRPLEVELSQAYSSIPIDDLDRFAQSLDFASWDQPVQDFNQQSAYDTAADDQLGRPSNTPSPGAMPLFYPPRPRALDPRTHHYSPSPPILIYQNRGSDTVLPILSNPPPMSGDYKSFKFFDDEAIPEAVTGEACYRYEKWKSDYTAVYDKFIPDELDITPVRVAVLDTGIDMTHPDVEARVERVKGTYNSLTDRHQSKVHDRNGHGTFTACLILDYAADVELFVAKIAEKDPSNPSVIAKAINWAVTEWKVDIISMSFGFPDRDIEGYVELENALQNAYANNVVLFAAASNSGGKLGRSFPAREPEVIAVHATDANGNRSHFSPTATDYDINLATVGEAVESAWPVVLCEDDTEYVKHKSGTSYATPIMAGMTAFLMMYARIHLPQQAHALKKQKAVKALLRRLADKGTGCKPRDDYHFVNVSLYSDNLFGKGKSFIDGTIKDILKST
ncbi:Putative peptidase S8/S53 domain, peptidase S8, subtilisin, Asp-active [Colletotrichum destructivum]|uniref:Peptidase S8/S53 domain, peptidase S8, subtilisin, Asp-active n=1 Tax=Colletotrichum destructivum TaxID=34406 RepID=A0AAX4ICE4_9PEZI|nr:Putative peptidase S8/S53 domain, peptidase S8, subtilisin, Asp-active [Colletotrichum destructivum]